jgi:hypothetical protein
MQIALLKATDKTLQPSHQQPEAGALTSANHTQQTTV